MTDIKELKERARKLTKPGSIHEVTISTVGKLMELIQDFASLPDEEPKPKTLEDLVEQGNYPSGITYEEALEFATEVAKATIDAVSLKRIGYFYEGRSPEFGWNHAIDRFEEMVKKWLNET